MEGHLFERRPQDKSKSMFGSGKLYKKRWCVLQGQILTVFDDLDLKSQKPKGLAKSHTKLDNLLARARVVNVNDKDKDAEHPYVFEIVPLDLPEGNLEDRKDPLVFAVENESNMSMWINALNEASNGDTLVLPLAQHCAILGLPNPAEHAIAESEVTHAYRKAIVKCHPDKPGGNERTFLMVQRSYEAVLRHLERTMDFEQVHFTVVLEKTVVAGIGLKVVADDLTGEIVIRGIHPKVLIHQLDAGAQGSLLDGDVLVGIGEESTLLWKFSRVRQRLNDYREPPGSYILLQFVRYVAHAEARFQHDDAADSVWSTTLGNTQTQPDGNAATTSASTAANVYPSAAFAASPGTPLNMAPRRSSMKITAPDLPLPPAGAGAAGAAGTPRPGSNALSTPGGMDLTLSPIAFNHVHLPAPPSGALLALQQENSEMKKQLHLVQEQLAAELKKSGKLTDIINRFGEEVRARNEALALAQQKEQYYRLQVQHMLFTAYNEAANGVPTNTNADVPDNQALHRSIASVSEKILKGREIFASDQTNAYMKKADIVMGTNKPHTYKHAQSMAVTSTSALDPSSAMLDIWEAAGQSAVDRLMQLERRLQKSEKMLGFDKIAEGFLLPADSNTGKLNVAGSIGISGAVSETPSTTASDNGMAGTGKQPVPVFVSKTNALTPSGAKQAHRPSVSSGLGFAHSGHAPPPPNSAAARRMTSANTLARLG